MRSNGNSLRRSDDCDYYLLIVGGRYGSLTPDGVSYTEKEYDYAIERGLKVIALLHGAPNELSVSRSEMSPESIEKLSEFRKKVTTGRLVKYWKADTDLPGLVALSLSKTIKVYPAIGWVRANAVANTDVLREINELRKRNEELETENSSLRSKRVSRVPDLAPLDAKTDVAGTAKLNGAFCAWSLSITWEQIFAVIAPHVLQATNDLIVRKVFDDRLFNIAKARGVLPHLSDHCYQTIKVQLIALGLVSVTSYATKDGTMALFWELTEHGQEQMMMTCTVKVTDLPAG